MIDCQWIRHSGAPEKAILWEWAPTPGHHFSCGYKCIFLTINRFNHSSAREVTAIQLLFRRLSLSSTRLSFPFSTVFKFSPKSQIFLSWTWRFSISFRVAYNQQNKKKQQEIKHLPRKDHQTASRFIQENTLLLPIIREISIKKNKYNINCLVLAW